MDIELGTPGVPDLPSLLEALGGWQLPGAPFQLHPGDVGWYWRLGAPATAAALRTWHWDQALAERILADVQDPAGSVLPAVGVMVGAQVERLLGSAAGSGRTPGRFWCTT